MSCVPHGQKYQPPAAGVSSADCWLKPDPFHNPQRQEGLPPEKQYHASVFEIICFLIVPVFIVGNQIVTSESQKSKSLMPVLKFCCLLASLSFWLFSADLLTRNCHCSSKALRRAYATDSTAYRFVHQISVFWHKMMLPCIFCSEKWKSMWGIGFTLIKKTKTNDYFQYLICCSVL